MPRITEPQVTCPRCARLLPQGVSVAACPACRVQAELRDRDSRCHCPVPARDRRYLEVWTCRCCHRAVA
jgi:hypothetical protein